MADTLAPLPGEEVVDASDCHITPGLIDAHSHICISEEGGGSEGDDCCDYSGTSTPELEVLDGLYPFDRAVKDCVRAGVTSCCVCPGRDGVVGGVASTIRLTGCVPDEMIVRRMTAMKCSVGENPKKANYSFCSRMGVAYQLRKSFDDALEYKYCKEEATKAGTHFHKDRGMEHRPRTGIRPPGPRLGRRGHHHIGVQRGKQLYQCPGPFLRIWRRQKSAGAEKRVYHVPVRAVDGSRRDRGQGEVHH